MVKWTTPAKHDLKQIHDYIARDSKFYAKKVSLEIVEKSEKIMSDNIAILTPEVVIFTASKIAPLGDIA